MHINTTLLSSTAFANPHIYAKLVSGRASETGGLQALRRRPYSGAHRWNSLISTSEDQRIREAGGLPGRISRPGYRSGVNGPSVSAVRLSRPVRIVLADLAHFVGTADAQKAAADAVTASQAPGLRSNISFTSGSSQARSGDRDRGHSSRSDRHRPVREGLDRSDGGSVGSNGLNIGSRKDEYRSKRSHDDPRRERSAAKWG